MNALGKCFGAPLDFLGHIVPELTGEGSGVVVRPLLKELASGDLREANFIDPATQPGRPRCLALTEFLIEFDQLTLSEHQEAISQNKQISLKVFGAMGKI